MAETSIEWADSVWNPVVGCTPVSAGCLNCYAATMARRLEGMGKAGYEDRRVDTDGRDVTGLTGLHDESDRTVRIAETRGGRAVFTGSVRCIEDRLAEPLRWRKPRRIFVCSMADLFHESVPFGFVDRVFAVAALCPQHQFLVLTKRPERMAEYLSQATPDDIRVAVPGIDAWQKRERQDWMLQSWPLPNVWLGTSVEDQAAADERIPHLLRCPAAVRFLSVEPLLEGVDLREMLSRWHCGYCDTLYAEYVNGCPRCHLGEIGTSTSVRPRRVDWVIVGGESGAKARPCNVEWIRGVVRQCTAASVPCFVKQVGPKPYMEPAWSVTGKLVMPSCELSIADRKGGDPSEWPADLRVRQMPEVLR